jgi:drug/metabolite transporter (DMT)-like permease
MPDLSTAKSYTLKVIFAFAAVYVIWGSTYLAIKVAIETIPPFFMAATRFLAAGLLLYGFQRLRGAPRPTRTNWGAAAVVGALMLVGGNGGVVWAEQTVPTGLAALVVATVPFWMVVIDWARPGGRRPAGLTLLGVTLGLVGLALLVAPWETGAARVDLVGVAAIGLGALCWAGGSIYSRYAPLPKQGLLGTGMEMVAGGAMFMLVSLVAGEWTRVDPTAWSLPSWSGLIYLVIFGSLVAFSAYIWLLKATSPARAATYAYVNPVVAVFLGWAFANEPVTPRTLLAAAVIVAAVAIITVARTREEHKVAPLSDSKAPLSREAA